MLDKKTRIAVFGLVNSTNCGDKFIAQSIFNILKDIADISLFDILSKKNRKNYFSKRLRQFIAFLIPKVPFCLRKICIPILSFVKFSFYSSYYEKIIINSDYVIIGGGQLFRDNDCYMACAINVLLKKLRQHNRKYMIIGCGVTPNWRKYAKNVFCSLFESELNIINILRDQKSLSYLSCYGINKKCIALSDIAWTNNLQPEAGGRYYGICLTAPGTMKYYGLKFEKLSIKSIHRSICNLLETILQEQKNILIFCNGNPEDYLYAKMVTGKLRKKYSGYQILLAGRPESVSELESIISSCKSIYSYRMHVAIISALKNIPCSLDRWDEKTSTLFFDCESVTIQRQKAGELRPLLEKIING